MRIWIAIALLVLPLAVSAKVYRYVNAQGVVTFTDHPPTQNAKPMSLKPLSVMGSGAPGITPAVTSTDKSAAPKTQPYAGFSMISPRPKETFQGTGRMLPVRLSADTPLQSGDSVVIYLDGSRQGKYSSFNVNIDGIPRGTHKVRAEIVKDGQTVASAGPVIVYMKQHSRRHNHGPFAFPNNVPRDR